MGLQDVQARTTRAVGVVDDDAEGDRKPSHDAFARTDEEASFDLAAKFLRMDRATRRAIALQYQPDESFMDASPDELSSIKIDEGRRTCSTKLEVHPTLPFRGKESDSSLKSRKYCRSIPSIDSLESRPESTKETARERISGDSGYGSDYRRRRIQSEYLRGADGSIQRREAAAGAGSTGTTANPQSQQGRQHRIPARVEYDDSDIEESFPESRHSTASFRRNATSANPVGGKSADAYGQATQRRPKPYKQSRQAKGLRRIRGSTALRPEKPTISSPTQRPNYQIPGRPSLETLDDASSSETGDQPKLETHTTGIQNTLLSISRVKPRPRSEVTPLSIPWSVASSRPRSEMFLCIAEFSESTGDSDGNSSIESSVFSIPESPIEEHHIHPDDPFRHHLDDAITAVTLHYPCCGAVFETEDAHDQHVRARQCQIIPEGVQRQGLTRAQIQEIHRRADPRKTEEKKWFAIWDICFPGRPHPTSAYIDNDLSEDLRSFREYFTSQGTNIISDFLHDSPSDRRIENEHVEAANHSESADSAKDGAFQSHRLGRWKSYFSTSESDGA
ncbi:hypothetical protein K4K61_006042 [Colletotrichum sp. SAR11_59]|nr:hypothetical protein K4K61_006042 [Colletotrichum sp. SAR11_59]